jgi:hypothetical protein
MGCPVSVGGKPISQPGCKEAVAKFLGTPVASTPAATAAAAGAVAATPAAAAAPAKKLSEADYRKACAVHFAPAAVTQRVKEYKDTNGSEYAPTDIVEKESREGVAKEDADRLARIASGSDADFKKAYENKDTYYQQMAAIPDGHPMLQKSPGIAMTRCLLKTRLAATPSLSAAVTAPAAAPKPDPATALTTVKGAPAAAAAPVAPAPLPATTTAAPVAAAPAAMPGVAHYQKVCAAHYTPANFELRARESRDSYGDTIEEARARTKQEDAAFLQKIATVSDAELDRQLQEGNGAKELLTMSANDPRLQNNAGARLFHCLLTTRVAAGKARAATAAPPAAVATTAAAPVGAGLKPGQFTRENMSQCLKYQLVRGKLPTDGAYTVYVFTYTNTCNVDLNFNAAILQDGVHTNLLRAGGLIKPRETREFKATVPVKKTMSLRMTHACETKEQVERALGRKVTSNNFNDQLRKCTGFFDVPSTGGVGR